MKKNPVIFFSISEYDNLGVGYIAAVLEEAGFTTKIMDIRDDKQELLSTVKSFDPLVIGFSIIFLNYIELFSVFIKYLRENGINCHFTAGGHYASLRYKELFHTIPQLDSIVLFEGEYPMLELADCLTKRIEWNKIKNIAYKESGKIVSNPLRPPETDLDKFPFPSRSNIKEYAFGRKFTVIVAGRGCVHNCSFCNTREFYRRAESPLKRIRKPGMVVNEMKILSDEKDCSVFIFHDDDFPVKSIEQPHWVKEFCNELAKTGLNNKILWKINCRPDDVEEKSFALMKKNGLYLVFLGLEDGTDYGLKSLNKQVTAKENIKAINILKKLKIDFDYGFMLFQPSTTFRSLRDNLDFLHIICGDGYTPITFLRLLPLYGTRVEKELKKTGRLIPTDGIADYEFLEEPMNRYYYFTSNCFSDWQRSPQGVENISKWARNYCSVYMHYFNDNPEGSKFCKKITKVIRESNLFLLQTMKELAVIFETGPLDKYLLENYKQRIESKHEFFRNEIINTMAELVSFVEALA
jgi:anaerobic magnesium-protoporphyrin IX monomethyl ester cyclase